MAKAKKKAAKKKAAKKAGKKVPGEVLTAVSPDGTKWRITISNEGTLLREKI